MPMGLRLKGGLDRAALRKTLDRIVARHEALRTIFAMVDGEPVQRIIPRRTAASIWWSTTCADRATPGRNWHVWRQKKPRLALIWQRSFDPWPADPVGGRGRCTVDHDAPHRLRWLVDGCIQQRIEHVVWRVSVRRSRSSSGAGDPICRLCGVAAEVDGRRDSAAAGGLLEGCAGRGPGFAGAAGRSSSPGAAGLCRRACEACVG